MTDKTLLSHGCRLWFIQPQSSIVDDQYLRISPIDCLYASKRSPPYGPLLLDMPMFMPDMLGATFCALLYTEPGPPMLGPPRPTTPIAPPLPLTHLHQTSHTLALQLAFHGLTDALRPVKRLHHQTRHSSALNVCDLLEPTKLPLPTSESFLM